MVNNPKRLTMKDLKNEKLFPRQSNIVTLQCSGTRRIEQINEYPGDGDELINAPVRENIPELFINTNSLIVGRRCYWNREMDGG